MGKIVGNRATERFSQEDGARIRQWFDHCRSLSSSERQWFLGLHEGKHPHLVAEVRSLLASGVGPSAVPAPPPAKLKPRRLLVLSGIALLAGGAAWLYQAERYLEPLFRSVPVKEGVGSVPSVPVSSGERCELRLYTKPEDATLTLDRTRPGGRSPASVALPCHRRVLVTALDPAGHMSHHWVSASLPSGEVTLLLPTTAVDRWLTWLIPFQDFHRRLLIEGFSP